MEEIIKILPIHRTIEANLNYKVKNHIKLNTNEYAINLKKHGVTTTIPDDEYKGSNTSMFHLCLIHNFRFKAQPSNVMNGFPCPLCTKERTRVNNENQYIKTLHVTGISDGLDAIDGKEVECTITVNIKQNGNLPAGFGAWTGTAMNLESGSYNAKYGKGLVDGTAHVEGTAKVTGDWGVHQGGQALLGELGREIIVRQGRFFTVGENGAEMHNLQPGDIVFNHVQTEELLKNGHISSRGKAYANGTVNKPSVLDRLRAQGYEVQKYEWKDMYGNLISPQQMNEAAKAWMSGTYECLTPMNDFKEKIKETVKVIEGANVVNNTMNQQPINQTFNITMPNVTDFTSANVLMKDLQSISTKKLQYNWKK